MDSSNMHPSGPPYKSTIASLGGEPTVTVDIPICAVFVFLYAVAAASHQTIFQLNRRRGHKFIISLALFGFCMARILTCSLRIAWAVYPSNVSLGIAAQLLVNVGILVVYVVDLVLVQRILRAIHPTLGWHRVLGYVFKMLYALLVIALVLVIVFTVLTFYTLDTELLADCRDIQLATGTYLLVMAALPLPLLLLAILLPGDPSNRQDFGAGSMPSKMMVVAVVTTLCTLEAGFKLGVNFQHPRPISAPAWYQSKACFYIFNFALEIMILYFYLGVKVDKRFWVPDGSSKRRHFGVEGDHNVSQYEHRASISTADGEKGSLESKE